ncbi:MAG: TonB-dependent receptor [Bacteroidota bacterium]
MNRFKLIAILWLMALALPVFSQDHTVKGTVTVAGTSIVILNKKDSVIQAFTRSKADGSFMISRLNSGIYLLLATYPDHADYTEEFVLDSNQLLKDIGRIKLIPRAVLLNEVMIKGTISAVKIKGDTTEYNAKAYKLNPNDKVEDLLKRLPGIQVDRYGRITAQGQTVNKVLVDGEEFFGDDPVLVTQNIRADMVDKIQLYDKKSDRAAFTSIDDGVKNKTINVVLKEDKKNGYFGKVSAGPGTDKYYKSEGMFNLFKPKQKLSAYGIWGNDGKTNLDWQDNAKYGSSNVDLSQQGSVIHMDSGDELESFSGRYNGQGHPLARTGGMHYDRKWAQDNQSVNINFKTGAVDVDGDEQTETENNLPAGTISSDANRNFRNSVFRQIVDLTYQLKFSANTELKITLGGGQKNTRANSVYTATAYTAGQLLNENHTTLDNTGSKDQFSAAVLYSYKLKKEGRTLVVYLAEAADKSNTRGYLNTRLDFFLPDRPDSMANTDQFKPLRLTNQAFNTSVTYTEPLFKQLALTLTYGLGNGNSRSDRRSYNRATNGDYSLLDSLYSNDFKLTQNTQQLSAVFNFKAGKLLLDGGANGSLVNFSQLDGFTSSLFTRQFRLLNPKANLLYQFSQQASLRFNYAGIANPPNVAQLQPVLINNDPLNITSGNPYLKPAFTHRFFTFYQSHEAVSGELIGILGSYLLTSAAVVNQVVTDSAGKSTTGFANLYGHKPANAHLALFYDRKIKPLDLIAGLNFDFSGMTSYSFVNNLLNRYYSNTYKLQSRFTKYVEQRYDFYVTAGPSYTVSVSSLQPERNNNGRGFDATADLNVYLPGNLKLAANANYQYTAATAIFPAPFERLLINASLSKNFLRTESLKLSLSGNDLLNQNTGFNRSINSSMITQNTYTTIKRYFMLSLSYDFNQSLNSAK